MHAGGAGVVIDMGYGTERFAPKSAVQEDLLAISPGVSSSYIIGLGIVRTYIGTEGEAGDGAGRDLVQRVRLPNESKR